MAKLKCQYFIAIVLMLVGLVGRLVAGSIPFPPSSPFSVPDQRTIAHETVVHSGHIHLVPLAAQSGKKDDHHKSNSSYPWYGLPFEFVPENSQELLSVISPTGIQKLFYPDLKSSLRPPAA